MIESKFINSSASILMGTSLVCGVGSASVGASENAGLLVDEKDKTSREEAVGAVINALEDLNKNGVKALGRVDEMLESLRDGLYYVVE